MFTRHVYTACLLHEDLEPYDIPWVPPMFFTLGNLICPECMVFQKGCMSDCRWLWTSVKLWVLASLLAVRWGPLLIARYLLFLFSPPSFSSWLFLSLPSCPLFFLSLLPQLSSFQHHQLHVRCALIRGEIESRHESKPNAAGPRAFQGNCICHDWRLFLQVFCPAVPGRFVA